MGIIKQSFKMTLLPLSNWITTINQYIFKVLIQDSRTIFRKKFKKSLQWALKGQLPLKLEQTHLRDHSEIIQLNFLNTFKIVHS